MNLHFFTLLYNAFFRNITGMRTTAADVLMGRDKQYPLSPLLQKNLDDLLAAIHKMEDLYGSRLYVSSGYRPGTYNTAAGGAKNSAHLTCEACDFHDKNRELTKWILANQSSLVDCGLYMESPVNTPTWVHLQIRPIPSGARIFLPK